MTEKEESLKYHRHSIVFLGQLINVQKQDQEAVFWSSLCEEREKI